MRHGKVEPVIIDMCASNKKYQKRVLKILAHEDKQLQKEKEYHRSQGRNFVPTVVQQQNATLWAEAKQRIPEAAKAAEEAEAGPQRRERVTDAFRAQMDMQEKLIAQYTQPSALDSQLMLMLANFSQSFDASSLGVQPVVPASHVPSAEQATLTKRQRLDELQQFRTEGTISEEEFSKARMHILTT